MLVRRVIPFRTSIDCCLSLVSNVTEARSSPCGDWSGVFALNALVFILIELRGDDDRRQKDEAPPTHQHTDAIRQFRFDILPVAALVELQEAKAIWHEAEMTSVLTVQNLSKYGTRWQDIETVAPVASHPD